MRTNNTAEASSVTDVHIGAVDLTVFDHLLDDVTQLETHLQDKEVFDGCYGYQTNTHPPTAGTAAANVP